METFAIIFTIVIHTLGIPVMIWAVRGDQGMRGLFGWFPDDEDSGGDGGSRKPETPKPGKPSGGLPLPVSEPPSTRLRHHGDRLADPGRAPQRRHRPARPAPERAPEPTEY